MFLLQHNVAPAQFLSSILHISHEFYELSYKYIAFLPKFATKTLTGEQVQLLPIFYR